MNQTVQFDLLSLICLKRVSILWKESVEYSVNREMEETVILIYVVNVGIICGVSK